MSDLIKLSIGCYHGREIQIEPDLKIQELACKKEQTHFSYLFILYLQLMITLFKID